MRKHTSIIVLSYFCLVLGPHLASIEAQQKMKANYDGHWWLSISPAEQSGFLNGYLDCYTYEFKGPAQFTVNPPDIARDLITTFYERSSSHLREAVSDIFYRFRNRPGEKTRAADGEPVKDRHGFYDGTYWKQMSALGGRNEQLGFVEGYLWCHARLARNKGGDFSQAPFKYVALITHWYGLVEGTGDIDAKREPEKIADALFKFRDHAQCHKAESK